MDEEQRTHGYVTVYIELLPTGAQYDGAVNAVKVFQQLSNKYIQAIESKSYYEAYSHVLKCLQNQPDTTQEGNTIPMQRLIVDVDRGANNHPRFIAEPEVPDELDGRRPYG